MKGSMLGLMRVLLSTVFSGTSVYQSIDKKGTEALSLGEWTFYLERRSPIGREIS